MRVFMAGVGFGVGIVVGVTTGAVAVGAYMLYRKDIKKFLKELNNVKTKTDISQESVEA